MYLEFKTIQIICCLIAIIMVLSCCNYVAKEKEYRGDLEMNKQQNIEKETTKRETTKKETAMEVTGESETQIERHMPEWVKDAVIYEVNIRQYTKEGTFEAFAQHLPRLKKMGVNTLWFMPIHPISKEKRLGTLGSYYAVADYMNVNPEFGTLDDFRKLVEKAHEMGFKVMLDWVANHTGWDNEWITEHPEWYLQDSSGQILSPPGMGWDDVAQLNYDNEELRNAMIDAMKFWVTEFDIDGFRCDYATGVPRDFWEQAREELTKVKELYMLAEDDTSKALLVKAFDSNYNWKLYNDLKSIAKGAKKAHQLRPRLKEMELLPEGSFPMNFLDNHDKNSWEGTIISNFGEDALPAMTVLLFTIPGIPLIYSGQEAGLDKSLEFFEKDQIIWDDLPYEALLTELCNIKQSHPALYNGEYGGPIEFLETENPNILAFRRQKGEDVITAVFNLSAEEQQETALKLPEDIKILIHGHGPISEGFKIEGIPNQNYKPWEYLVFSN